MKKFSDEIKKELKKYLGVKEIILERPPSSDLGDYSFPCFSVAKQLKKGPNEIAQELCKKIKLGSWIKRIEVKGPYLNFFINKKKLVSFVLNRIDKEKDKYGSSGIGKGKKALIEHTSVNPNASPHVGRARNALIGDALTRLLIFHGFKVETHYIVNDVGKQIAILVLGCGKKKKIRFDDLLNIYIKISKKVEKSKKLEQEALDLLKKLEDGDKKTRKRFREVVDICIKGQKKILEEFGIKHDYYDYESKYLFNKETDKILKKLEKTKKVFTDKDGRKILDQKEFKLAMRTPVLVLTRKDGTSLYVLRDLAYTIEKMKKTKYNYWVLGEDHKLYYKQIKAALSLLKFDAPTVIHYSFVLLTEGKMSTRKGNLVLLEDFMKEIVAKAKKGIIKRNGKTKNLDKLAKIIGYGAAKFSILKVSAEKNVLFDWKSALNFEGETAPYIQYAHARICSIIRKYRKSLPKKADFSLLKEEEELSLVKKLSEFPEICEKTMHELKIHPIASYLTELSQDFNEFYHKHQILKAEKELKDARLILANSIKQILKTGLSLLGIESPERM